jgi:uncharacterized protein (DUF302 family)
MRTLVGILAVVGLLGAVGIADGRDGRVAATSRAPFNRVSQALEQAIADAKMTLVCRADAQQGAASRGVAIKGNQVFMVFRNDFAVRLLAADLAAGFEAPIRIYLYENPDGTATVAYTPPTAIFAPYRNTEVRAVAAELDPIFKTIVDRALAAQ